MKPIITRTLSGSVLVAVMVGMILLSVETLLAMTLIIAVLSASEFLALAGKAEGITRKWTAGIYVFGVIAAVIGLTYGIVWKGLQPCSYLALLPLGFLLFVFQLYNKKSSPMRRLGTELTAILYIAVPMSLLLILGAGNGPGGVSYNRWLVLFYVILIWINDIGAYLVGMSIGKHRLFERLSPKKSWEGFFGGLAFTLLASVFLGPWMTGYENTPVGVWIIFGVVLTLSAVAGDLVESMLKREAGVKDSGNLIPGHGGFLDRFDAMFLSLPFVYLLVRLMA